MLEAVERVRAYTEGFSFAQFSADRLRVDAVVRNLEVLGEAAKQLPDTFRTTHPEIDWRKIAGLRDILIHQYFGVDLEIVWDILVNKIPALETELRRMIEEGAR